MKRVNKTIISTSISLALTWMVCSALPMASASDISIYADSTKGNASILLMLDTSGSMGISSLVIPTSNVKYGSPGDVTKTVCTQKEVYETSGNSAGNILEYQYNAVDNREYVTKDGERVLNKAINGLTKGKTSFYKEVRINGVTVPYYVRGCGLAYVDENTGKLIEDGDSKFDRLSRLKDAIITLLADKTQLDDQIQIGLGHYSSQTDFKVGSSSSSIKLVDGHSGTILIPVGALTNDKRLKLAQQIAKFQSVDTTSKQDGQSADNEKVNNVDRSKQRYSSTNPPEGVFKASSGTPTVHAYAEAGAYMMGTRTRDAPTVSSHIRYIYDGSSTVRKGTEQIYFICVEVKTGNNANNATTLGADYVNVKQCVNQWPGLSDGKLSTNTKNNMRKPNGEGGWVQPTENEITTAFGSTNISDWQMYTKMPVGWRYGGWMKVEHEPMDIEPITASPWVQTGADRNLVSYRANPFSLNDKMNNNNTNNGYEDNLGGGFSYSALDTKEEIGKTRAYKYKAGGSTNSCDGNGVYFLTDGAPNSTKNEMARAIINDSLNTSWGSSSVSGTYGFNAKPEGSSVLKTPVLQSQLFSGETGGWEYIGEYAKKLADKSQNPAGMEIKTAVVGFGASFADLKNTKNCEALKHDGSVNNLDAYNACKWGGDDFGKGGFYYAENAEDIKKSIIDFVRKVEVEIDPVVTGNPVIPVDALNPTELQTEAYYATFEPKVSSTNPLWIGNLNKYRIKDGELYSANGSARLISSNGSLNKGAYGYWADGVLGVLQVGASKQIDPVTQENKIKTHRTIYTDKDVSASALRIVDVNSLFDSGYFTNDVNKNYWLNVLGYRIGATEGNLTKDKILTTPVGKQLGAVMHSTPVLLTQEGRINVTSGTLTSSERKDYLMFGSTQGILHVVDTSTGEEVFGFVPNEMMNNQKAAFLLDSKEQTAAGMSGLFYGIDAPWVAHTKYTTTNNGLLTVKDSGRKASDEDNSENLKGYQWVYGGLRMGGKSYYALDLSDLTSPKLKFHINPNATNATQPLKRMGQSWSKPTIGYVKWGGKKKLVMFVGGGYDATGEVTCTSDTNLNNKGYECPTYAQTNKAGAGVYMFDANNGELLWWSSVDNNNTPAASTIRFTANTDLQYSVVSQINAVDRNADGLIDHLYFGDLAGQAFRVDLDNTIQVTETQKEDAAKNKFAKRVVTLFSEHVTTGLSPRFYEMPSVSTHKDDGKIFAAVAFSSGNRSTPLAESSISANDGVFVLYDNDIANRNLYNEDYSLISTKANNLQNLDLKVGIPRIKNDTYVAGWKHSFGASAGTYKGMNDLYALDSMLYVNVYHKDGTGISGNCGGGVKGDSYLFQYCLPFGKCDFYTASTTNVNKVKLGAGILGTSIGKGYGNQNGTLSLVVNRDNPSISDCSKNENKNLPQCQLFNNPVSLKQLRWYEAE